MNLFQLKAVALTLLLFSGMRCIAATETIFHNNALCDFHNFVCVNVKIVFDVNAKIMEIRGRLYRPHGEGTLTFYLNGITPIDEQISHPVAIAVKGQYNEIISAKFQPPLSNQTEWSLKEMVFDPLPKQVE